MSVSFIFAAIAQINLHWQEDEEAAEKRATIKRVENFRFINILKLFFLYFFNYFTLSFYSYTFFTHDIYPHPHPRPTTFTHYPRNLTTIVLNKKKINGWQIMTLGATQPRKISRKVRASLKRRYFEWIVMGLNRLQNVNSFTSLGAGTRRKENFNKWLLF